MEMQHYVSKFIVKNWAVDDGHLNIICRDEYRPDLIALRRGPSHSFCWPDLYTIRANIENISLKRYLEHDAPSIVEPQAGNLIKRYSEAPYERFLKITKDSEKETIRSLIRLHFVRHPESIKWALQKFVNLIDEEGRSLPESFQLLNGRMDSIDDMIRYLLGATLADTKALEGLEKADYMFYRLPLFSSEAFLLSDVLTLPSFLPSTIKDRYPKGVAVLPTSPSSVILVSSIPNYFNDFIKKTDKQIVRLINRGILEKAKYGIAVPNDSLAGFVRNHFRPKFYFSYKTKTFLHENGELALPEI